MLMWDKRNDLTTPLADFVLTSSFTKPNPEGKQSFCSNNFKTYRQQRLNLAVQCVNVHTIAFVEDVFGRLAQVSIAGRHGHCICRQRQTIKLFFWSSKLPSTTVYFKSYKEPHSDADLENNRPGFNHQFMVRPTLLQ